VKIIARIAMYPPPTPEFNWFAVDDDTYDGAEDSRCPVGWGATEQAAIEDLKEQLELAQ
jgi:hypothetical protein